MARKAPRTKKPKEIHLYVGTRKGAFIFRSDLKRKNWKIEGPFFAGSEVTTITRDPRSGNIWAAPWSAWFGPDLQVSSDRGRTWRKCLDGVSFAPERKLSLTRVWRILPDRETRPNTLWCGADPGALFRSDDAGKHWYEVAGLTQHPTRDKWNPGAAGMMVHALALDPWKPYRIYAGISAAGCFRSDDDGKNWKPLNTGVRADFLPNKFPEVGQCLHSMALSPTQPDLLFQQNHCGVYRSKDAGATWEDIGDKKLPSRFGFAIAVDPHEVSTVYTVPEDSAERRYVMDAKLTVYRSRNGGGKWEKLTNGLPQKNAYTQVLRHAMTTDGADKTGVYVGTTSGEIFYSRNGGDKWELMQSSFPSVVSLHAALV